MADGNRNTPRREPTYSEIVWEQFKKNRIAYAAFWLFVALFVIAIISPIISLDQPFWATIENDAGVRETVFPWFGSLLFNSNVFGKLGVFRQPRSPLRVFKARPYPTIPPMLPPFLPVDTMDVAMRGGVVGWHRRTVGIVRVEVPTPRIYVDS